MAGAPPGGDGGGGLSPHAPSLRVVAAPRGGPARLRAAGRRVDSFVVGLLELQEGLSAPHFVWSLSPRGAAGRLGAARRRPDSFVVGLLNPKRACRTLASFHSLPPRGGPARLRAAGRRADSFVVGLLELQEGLMAASLPVVARVAARCGRSLPLSSPPQAGLRPLGCQNWGLSTRVLSGRWAISCSSRASWRAAASIRAWPLSAVAAAALPAAPAGL